jgi:hypothetical protein
MKPNEIRVDNWCQSPYEKEPFKIKAEHILQLEQGMDELSILGIPLTPEILVKAGFRQSISNEKVYVLKIGENNLMLKNDVAWFYWAGLSYPFKYLHQIQNLVYAIHGEELNIQL